MDTETPQASRTTQRVAKKIFYWLFYALFLLFVFAAVDYFFWYRPWVQEKRAAWSDNASGGAQNPGIALRSTKHVEPETIRLLGKARSGMKSRFTAFAKAKPEGVVRICTHGDSFTAGDEVDSPYDYPGRLQELFERQGIDNIEVVNFGVSGYGFHQVHLMWELVAQGFDCDMHLLGPRGFQPIRDMNFGLIYDSWSPYYFHARYVLDGQDEVRLVEVLGETYRERFDHFFRFVPHWQYLRYSRRPPAFLMALIPKGRALANPFYYDRRPMQEEAHDTYRILLRKMAQSGVPIILGHHQKEIVELARGLNADNLSVLRPYEKLEFPFVAPGSHGGPQANDLLARQFLALMTNQREDVPLLTTSDLDWATGPGPRRTMSSYSEPEIQLADVTIGRLVIIPSSKEMPNNVDALVSIKSDKETIFDSGLFGLDLELQPDMPVVLRVGNPTSPTDYPIGRLSVLGQGLNIGRADIEGFEYMTYKDFWYMKERGEPNPLTQGGKSRHPGLFFFGNAAAPIEQLHGAPGPIAVLVDGKPALRGEPGELGGRPGIWFVPEEGSFRSFRASRAGWLAMEDLADSGTIDFVVDHWEDGRVRVPMAAWHKKPFEVPRPDQQPAKILSLGADRRARFTEPP